MSIATETRELIEVKMEVIHKIFLVNQLQAKGYSKAAANRSEDDCAYLASIVGKDAGALKRDLEKQLFEL